MRDSSTLFKFLQNYLYFLEGFQHTCNVHNCNKNYKNKQIQKLMESSAQQIKLLDSSKKQSLLVSDQSSIVVGEADNDSNSMKKTPYFTATFAMMAAALGTGIFNLPLRVTQIGVVLFMCYVAIAAAFSFLGCKLLHTLIVRKKFSSYGQICQVAFGNWLKRLLQFCIIAFPWGIAICFQVIIPKFIIQLLADVFDANLYQDRDKQINNSTGNWLRIGLNIIIITSNFYLIQLRDISKIQKLSVIGVCSVIYNAFVILLLMFTGFTHKGQPDIQYFGILKLDWSIVQWAIFGEKAFSAHCQAIASILFCYINHQLVFPTCKNMQNPTNERLMSCFFRSNFSELMIYIVIGLSGYLLLMPHEDIFPINSMVLTSINAWPITIGKCLMIIALYLAIPLNLFPARTVLKQALGLKQTTRNHYLLSVGLAASSCIVAITFVKVNTYFGLLGGTTGVLMACGIPALCFWKLIMKTDPNQNNAKNCIMLVFTALVCIFGIIGGILSVLDSID